MAASKKAAPKKGDWYAIIGRNQHISYYTAEELHGFLNPPIKEDGTRREIILLKSFPRAPGDSCPFSAYNRKGQPFWPYNAYFIMKNGVEVFAPEAEVTKVEVEVKTIPIDGYKPKKASTKK